MIEQEWGKDLITSWNINGWIDHPGNVGDKIGALVGGGDGNVVVCDSTSVNLFKALGAGLALRPGRNVIISEDGNFPTDLYMIQGMLALLKGCVTIAPLSRRRARYSSGCVRARARSLSVCWQLRPTHLHQPPLYLSTYPQSYAVRTHELKTVKPDALADTLASDGDHIAAVCLTHVNYKTGLMYAHHT